MSFELVQIAYWLALSTWFGGVLFIVVAAPVIHRTIDKSDLTLPHVSSVNLQGQHGTLLAGTVIGTLVGVLARIEVFCAAVLLLTLIAQWFQTDMLNRASWLGAVMRTAFYLAATFIVVYDWRVLWPRIWQYRQEFIDNADDPDKANPALEEFDHWQSTSLTMWNILVFLLLGIVLFSGAIRPPVVTYSLGH